MFSTFFLTVHSIGTSLKLYCSFFFLEINQIQKLKIEMLLVNQLSHSIALYYEIFQLENFVRRLKKYIIYLDKF